MVHPSLPVAAQLLGLAATPAFARTTPAVTEAAASRTQEQNRRVSVGLPALATPR